METVVVFLAEFNKVGIVTGYCHKVVVILNDGYDIFIQYNRDCYRTYRTF